MADGDITGRLAKYGTVVPGSAAETVITGCEITLPTADGFFHLFGRVALHNSTGTTTGAVMVQAVARVDGGSVSALAVGTVNSTGSTGVTVDFDVTGTTVKLTVVDCNGIRAVGLLEAFGVEYALAIG